MVSKTFVIRNQAGIHLKPAAALCTEAIKYQSVIRLISGTAEANAKSVLNVLSACVRFNDEITLVCDGVDEESALENIGKLIQEGLGEQVVADEMKNECNCSGATVPRGVLHRKTRGQQ